MLIFLLRLTKRVMIIEIICIVDLKKWHTIDKCAVYGFKILIKLEMKIVLWIFPNHQSFIQ